MSQKADNYRNFFQALLKAKSKNQVEDMKLRKWLTELDVARKHNDRLIFNEIFEQKREAYRLNFESKGNSEKHMKSSNSGGREPALKGKLRMPKLVEEEAENAAEVREPPAEAPESGLPSKTRRLSRGGSDVGLKLSITPRRLSGSLPNLPRESSNDDLRLDATAGNVYNKNGIQLVSISEETKNTMVSASPRNARGQPLKRASFPNVIDNLLGEQGAEQEFKRRTSLPLSFPSLRLTRSITAPDMASVVNLNKNEQAQKGSKDSIKPDQGKQPDMGSRSQTIVDTQDFWVGDPKAIGSVRRPRLDIADMTAKNKSVGQLRRLKRDMPQYPSCSRNCNRPGAEFEGMVNDLTPLPASKIKADLKKEMKARSQHLKSINQDDQENEKQGENLANLSFVAALALVDKVRQRSKNRRSLVPTTRELHKAVQEANQNMALKAKESVGRDVNKSMRVTVGYKFERAAPLRRPSYLKEDLVK